MRHLIDGLIVEAADAVVLDTSRTPTIVTRYNCTVEGAADNQMNARPSFQMGGAPHEAPGPSGIRHTAAGTYLMRATDALQLGKCSRTGVYYAPPEV